MIRCSVPFKEQRLCLTVGTGSQTLIVVVLLLTGVSVWRGKMLLKSSSAAAKEVCVTTSSSTVLTATSRRYQVRSWSPGHLFVRVCVAVLEQDS